LPTQTRKSLYKWALRVLQPFLIPAKITTRTSNGAAE
jgi:hypothetical protein